MKTRISVIIPVYNVQEFLEECIDSVLAQTINDMELTDGYERNLQIILVDDGSTDRSSEIAKGYACEHENIEYVHEENQGLGHARNYGCEFAIGDYIIFLDSDDIVPPNAYEWMYTAALKNKSDMTIGNVWRYKSEKALMSNIHQVAFSHNKEVTHITETPELFFDTTAWNKLIRRSFWDEHGFRFPEGILYEDIPVTIPMHFLANNVSIVHENCYLWRIREGISKSITQTISDLKNLSDRLFVMREIDDFFDKNVDDEKLLHVKKIKWLKFDLMIFINKLKSISEDESEEIISMLKEYFNNNFSHEDLKILNEFNKLKYEYLLGDEFKKLVDLLNFQTETLNVTKVYKKDNHVMFDADDRIFKKSPFYIDQFIRESPSFKFIQSADFCKDDIEIKGFCVIPGLEIDDFGDRNYKFTLQNSTSRKRIPLKHEDVKTGDLTSYDIRYGRRFSYKSAGYKVSIPYSELSDNPDFAGENRILVSFTQDGINENFFACSEKDDIRDETDMHANICNDTYFRFRYTLRNEVIIEVIPLEDRCDGITMEDNSICIHTQDDDELSVYYKADSINDEAKIPLVYDADKKCHKIDIDELGNLDGIIIKSNGKPLIYKSKEVLSLHSNKGQCIIDATKDYYLKISKYENTSEIYDIKGKNGSYEFTSKLYSSGKHGNLKSASLYFKNNLNWKNYIVSRGKFKPDSDEVKFKLDLSNKNVTKNLNFGPHNMHVEYEFDDGAFSTSLHLMREFKEVYNKKYNDYTVHRAEKGKFQILVHEKWPILEDTPGKRLRHSRITYKAFQKLPMHKKRIVFESMWGAKYNCNPRYLYEYIDKNHPDWECVWILNDEHVPVNGNAVRARRMSIKYFYYLATSKYFVNNVNFHDHYIKRPGQIEIQTMHGTPLKTLGLDIPNEFPTKKQEDKFIKKCGRWNYLAVQSDYVVDVTTGCYKFKNEYLKTGYPRTDILYTKNNDEDIRKIKDKMGLPVDKKVILYAPTWRINNKFDLMLDLDSFKKSLSDEYILILRLHPFSANGWIQPPEDDFIYDLTYYDTVEELYLISDILITDYSSVMFDYSILNRPIFLFTYDLYEYKDKLRGTYFDIIENAPGPVLYTSKEVEDAILNIDETEAETKDLRKKFRDRFNQYECADSCEKIFSRVMGDENEGMISKILSKILP